jgi:hypothetical protein
VIDHEEPPHLMSREKWEKLKREQQQNQQPQKGK